MERERLNKRILLVFGIISLGIWAICYFTSEPEKLSKQWSVMNMQEREAYLNEKIENRGFDDAEKLQIEFEHIIEKEFKDPSSVRFELEPSVYNGLATVVETDSAWIHITFKGTAKNSFNANMPFSGMATLQYNINDNTLSIKTWSMSE